MAVGDEPYGRVASGDELYSLTIAVRSAIGPCLLPYYPYTTVDMPAIPGLHLERQLQLPRLMSSPY